jgi:type IV secretory pathway VirD2 relaxase
MHRLIFSLSRQEFESCGFTSWKPIIREALGAVERYHGIRLEWVAAEHMTKAHPHVHVDIKSVYLDRQGKPQRLRITNEMRQNLRWAVEGIMKRERDRVREERQQQLEIQRGLERFVGQLTRSLARGLADAAHDDDPTLDPFRQRRRPKRQPEERSRDEGRER